MALVRKRRGAVAREDEKKTFAHVKLHTTSREPSVISISTSLPRGISHVTNSAEDDSMSAIARPPGSISAAGGDVPRKRGETKLQHVEEGTRKRKYTSRATDGDPGASWKARALQHDQDGKYAEPVPPMDQSTSEELVTSFTLDGKTYHLEAPSTREEVAEIIEALQTGRVPQHPINGNGLSNLGVENHLQAKGIESKPIPGLLGRLLAIMSYLASSNEDIDSHYYGEADLSLASNWDLLYFMFSGDLYSKDRPAASSHFYKWSLLLVVFCLLLTFIYMSLMPRWKLSTCASDIVTECGTLEMWHNMRLFCMPAVAALNPRPVHVGLPTEVHNVNIGPAKDCRLTYYRDMRLSSLMTNRNTQGRPYFQLTEQEALCYQILEAEQDILTLSHEEITKKYGCRTFEKFSLPSPGFFDSFLAIIDYWL